MTRRTAVVTGAARGMGAAIAHRLADDGARVVVLDVEDGTETVASIREDGGDAEYRECDVTDEDGLDGALSDLEVDVLVNNAAIYGDLIGNTSRFDGIDVEDWRRVLDVNVTGVFLASKAAFARMDAGGAIVNVASNVARLGVPGFLHYVASKGAVVSMTRAMATELGPAGIRVNAVMPGLTMTESSLRIDEEYLEGFLDDQAIDRRLQPEEVANAVAFLAGSESEPTTGQVYAVDPGQAYY